MDFNRIGIFIRTLRNLKLIQVRYQLLYRLRRKRIESLIEIPDSTKLNFNDLLTTKKSYCASCFEFLNQKVCFDDIDWNYAQNGKLWTYNLNYFDFLFQAEITNEESLGLITDFCEKSNTIRDGYEPYPISLRVINWIKFCSTRGVNEAQINRQIYCDLNRLKNHLEYHILANHLLENGFGLLFGAYYFKDESLYLISKDILNSELKEQILSDGGHYELSPMYHNIILSRVLDSYNLVKNNRWKSDEIEDLLLKSAVKMLAWANAMGSECGEMPLLNDSAREIAPSIESLNMYGSSLSVDRVVLSLSESGYRKWRKKEFECFIDVGQISPSYQPGHSHADSLNFLLNYKGRQIIVDTGVSTYEKNERRQIERSTSSHNTVTLNKRNSSEVWDGFRVGRRAEVSIELEDDFHIVAAHNGYRNISAVHKREFMLHDNGLTILDSVSSMGNVQIQGHMHFNHDVKLEIGPSSITINDELIVLFEEKVQFSILEYKLSIGFNNLVSAQKAIYTFSECTTVKIFELNSVEI